MLKQFIVKRTVTVNLQHSVVVIIHAHIQQFAYMVTKCNMKLATLDSNANPDAVLNENVHIPCNAMKNVKLTKIVKMLEDAVVKVIVLTKLFVKVIKLFMIIVIAPVSV